ncbi:Probable poly(glycerol-phosphate) alpha-glucosyltransferase [Roseburia inulinivorans]|uniref:Probable poly(Glycerol-phosphate) alpha-glucosyltransferase n=1 Tax=Roseburia inulinivorans TaxID=360807 RepID=A0A173XQD2_9FIRM|nr:Probable poly(glycerol-phosphate) alpha-glucosyltransferase [Roseburia inulinivorans]
MKKVHKEIPDAKLLLLGQGEFMSEYQVDVKRKGMQEYVTFLGYRSDVNKICALLDVLVSASYQEGLPMNMIEAMAVGIPVVCSDIRGQRDLIKDGKNGYLFQLGDSEQYCNRLVELYNNQELREEIKENNLRDVKKYSIDNAIGAMERIYRRYM